MVNWNVPYLRGVKEALFFPLKAASWGRGDGGWRLEGVCRGLWTERKRVNHVCNRTGFPLKWETEVGSVQIYGAP